MTLSEAAERLHMPPATLRYWRQQATGPRSFKVGRRIMYREADVEAWLQQQYDAADGHPAA